MKLKVVESDTESTESKISWDSKIDSSDNDILAQPICKDQLQKISNLQQDLKPGDYVLVKFKPVGKKKFVINMWQQLLRLFLKLK